MKYLRYFSARPFTAFGLLFVALVVVLCAPLAPAVADFITKNYMESGTLWRVGGTLDVKTGGKLTFNNVDKTAALTAAVANPVNGVAAGYKVARGETALDGTNPTPAATGLTTIVACTASIKSATAPGVGTSAITYDTSSATLNLYGWKVTATGDATLIASTGTETIGWVCVGT